MTTAVLILPLLGGILYHGAGYLAVFALVFGLIGADIILRLSMTEKIAATWQAQRGKPILTGNDHSQIKAGLFEKSAADVTKQPREMCSISVMTIASQDKDYKDEIDFEKVGAESPAMNTAVFAPHAKGLPGKSPADLPPTSSSRLPAILCLLVSPRLSAAL